MKLLRELLNPEHAGADLCLLREVAPQSDLLKSPLVKAARQAEKILYTLLDHTTAERIRLNRRRPEEEEVKPETHVPDETNKETGDEQPVIPRAATPQQSEGDTPGNAAEDYPTEQPGEDDVKEQLEETQSELEDAQAELEETKIELESTQEELEETKEQLEEEKKSEVVPEPLPVPEPALPNDKKKTNTRPSTGKTSSTVTSK